MIQNFRTVSYLEASTFLAVLFGTVLKHAFDSPGLVSVMGPIHGVVFLVYLVMVLKVRDSQGWALGQTLLVILAAAIPVGGFFVGQHLRDEALPA